MPPKKKKIAECPYGKECYRKNPAHFEEYVSVLARDSLFVILKICPPVEGGRRGEQGGREEGEEGKEGEREEG